MKTEKKSIEKTGKEDSKRPGVHDVHDDKKSKPTTQTSKRAQPNTPRRTFECCWLLHIHLFILFHACKGFYNTYLHTCP